MMQIKDEQGIMEVKRMLRVRFGLCLNVPMTRSAYNIALKLRGLYTNPDVLAREVFHDVRLYCPNASPEVGQAVVALALLCEP